MRSWTTSAIFFALMMCSATASAEVGRQVEFETGFGQLDEDWLLSARIGFLYFDEVDAVGCRPDDSDINCVAPVALGLQLPVRFEIIDDEPSDDDIVRSEDWDEPADFFRLLRFAEYGLPHQALHVRFGELGGVVLGHGTIANGYQNSVTTGDFNPGFEGGANTAYGGLSVFLNNVARPSVFGARGHVRPWGFGQRGWWHRFAIGVSTVSDFSAPLVVESGDPVRGQPVVAEQSDFSMVGLDLELTPVDNGVVELLTYADLNLALGVGGHLGASLRVAFGEDWTASLRAEGRLLGAEYIPDYFGPIYDIERYQFTGWGTVATAPKARIAASRGDFAYGGFGQLGVSFRNWVSVALAAAEHSGDSDTSAWVRLSVTPPGPFTMGLYWARLNGDPSDLHKLDGALFASEARLSVWGPIYLQGRYDRLWRLAALGNYSAAVEWQGGVGVALPL